MCALRFKGGGGKKKERKEIYISIRRKSENDDILLEKRNGCDSFGECANPILHISVEAQMGCWECGCIAVSAVKAAAFLSSSSLNFVFRKKLV